MVAVEIHWEWRLFQLKFEDMVKQFLTLFLFSTLMLCSPDDALAQYSGGNFDTDAIGSFVRFTPEISGASTGCNQVTLTAIGGASFSWNGGATPDASSNTFTNSGVYSVTVTNSGGCTATVSRQVTVAAPPMASVSGETSGCGSVRLTASGGVSYSWNGGVSPVTASNTFLSGGTYTVTVTDINGCTATASVVVSVN